MKHFTFTSLPQRVVFGVGSLASLPAEVDALGLGRVLVLSTPEQSALAQDVLSLLGARGVGVFAKARMHVPIEIAREAVDECRRLGIDGAIAIGGGSTIGLGKIIALEMSLPVIAVPTTYAGSEATTIHGSTEAGDKRTGKNPRVLPRVIVYDPELTLSLPARMTLVSGLNGIAHAAEALYAHDGNPIASLMAEDGIRAIAKALPILQHRPADLIARGDALYGAWLCGAVLGQVSIGLHHKLCHTLGGRFDLPHAEMHAVVLPHALAYNAHAAPEAMRAILRALGEPGSDSPMAAASALFHLSRSNGAPLALKDLGLSHDALDEAADLACRSPYPNPRPLDRDAIRALLARAHVGAAPQA